MKYIIAGNGVAGTTAAEHIRKNDPDGSITVVSDEAIPFYSRIRLIDFLAGDLTAEDLIIRDKEWYRENRIDLMLGTRVESIDTGEKEVALSNYKKLVYDRLLLASGGIAFVPPAMGAQKKGVFTLRTIDDARNIVEHVGNGNKRAVLIGGGVLGLEAGNSLLKAGCSVTVVEFFPRLLPRQMDSEGAEILRAQMEKKGFSFHLGVSTEEITGRESVDGIMLNNGIRIDCDMVLISAGVRPNTLLAGELNLTAAKGLTVNDRMETGISDVYAAGDLARHRGVFYGIWPAAEKQGEVAGINMAGGNAVYKGTTISNILKVAGVKFAAAGDIDPDGKHEAIVLKDSNSFIYKKLVIDESKIIGAILYGDLKDMMKIFRTIEDKKNIENIRHQLEKWNLQYL
ncbi:nitrite reductase [NAD(P)H] [bacterium BMS3Bbin05]|nr:nitrite reductase [NAD(P)H] [bacterium BMS3Bbin05]HDO23033.1 NAD(P)/FAD-dependent oxidoreductase [Nitrospirota bacterium]